MASSPSSAALQQLKLDLVRLVDQLAASSHGEMMYNTLSTLVHLAESEVDRLDWKILKSSLQDLAKGFEAFYPHRHTRKIAIFGSARLEPDTPEYQLAVEFARRVAEQGFMVMTGAGGGIMEAGNKGAGPGQSFGLNIQLPFEQGANPFIAEDQKLIDFKYFFTRKLFFLKETDAIALFPGGFGTQDEAFECLTLSQTGKSPPIPLVLVDRPGGSYWQEWDAYLQKHLIQRGLISAEDDCLYTITDNLEVAYKAIIGFYRVYHSSRYVGNQLVIRLKEALSNADVEKLNTEFSDILLEGKIEKHSALPEEVQDEQPLPNHDVNGTITLPRLVFHFNQRDHGRLYQLIAMINQMGAPAPETEHPERK